MIVRFVAFACGRLACYLLSCAGRSFADQQPTTTTTGRSTLSHKQVCVMRQIEAQNNFSGAVAVCVGLGWCRALRVLVFVRLFTVGTNFKRNNQQTNKHDNTARTQQQTVSHSVTPSPRLVYRSSLFRLLCVSIHVWHTPFHHSVGILVGSTTNQPIKIRAV